MGRGGRGLGMLGPGAFVAAAALVSAFEAVLCGAERVLGAAAVAAPSPLLGDGGGGKEDGGDWGR